MFMFYGMTVTDRYIIFFDSRILSITMIIFGYLCGNKVFIYIFVVLCN